MPSALCHPNRSHYARGLCASCYHVRLARAKKQGRPLADLCPVRTETRLVQLSRTQQGHCAVCLRVGRRLVGVRPEKGAPPVVAVCSYCSRQLWYAQRYARWVDDGVEWLGRALRVLRLLSSH